MMPMALACSCFGFAPDANTFARSLLFAPGAGTFTVLFDNDRTVGKA